MGKRRLPSVTEMVCTEIEGGSDDDQPVDVKPVNEIIKRTSKGKSDRKFYEGVELDGVRYNLDDSVLVAPEQKEEKPYVAIIKEIKQEKNRSVAITGQWFYRPEEAEKKGGGTWPTLDSRELFYSFHRDEVPLESVMHACVVHFIPPLKQPPNRSKHPGFIIRHVYDAVEKKLWKLTDKDYEDSKQKELDLLVQRSRELLGELPSVEGEEVVSHGQEETDKLRRSVRRKSLPLINVNRDDSSEILAKGDTPGSLKADTPASCKSPGIASHITDLLHVHNVSTGQVARDRWLEKLITSLKDLFGSQVKPNSETAEAEIIQQLEKDSEKDSNPSVANDGDRHQDDKGGTGSGVMKWPETAISVVKDLESLANDVFHGSDTQKYKSKMRQLDFNLKKNSALALRLLRGELTPSVVFHMTPAELKDGFTTAEKNATEKPESQPLQMTSILCSICGAREVGIKDIIPVRYGSKYKLECQKCGRDWYGSMDSISIQTTSLEANQTPTIVGLAPWATSKFEEVEKKEQLVSPREFGKSQVNQNSIYSRPSKPDELEGTQKSHYEEVVQSLTEHISLHVPAPITLDQSKPTEGKDGAEKDE